MKDIKRTLIVGGAGYIGTVLTDYLLNKGLKVSVLDNFLYKNNHCVLSNSDNNFYSFRFGDLCNKETLDRILQGVTDVVVLAGLVGDPITKKYPDAAKQINEIGIQNLVTQLNGRGIDRLIFVSTCSNYGLIKDDELADEEFELNPLSLYAKAKVATEKYLLSLDGQLDYTPTILRFATAFGLSPRMRFDLTVSEFTRDLAIGKELLVFDAQTWRPYCHVRDFARLIHKVLQAPQDQVSYQVFNAGGDINNYTKQMIVDTILEYVPNAKVKFQKQGSDPRNYRVDFKKVREVLGFEPEYSVRDGIVELLDAIENHVFDYVDETPNLYGNYEINYSLIS